MLIRREGKVSKVVAMVVMCVMLSSCYKYLPFTNVNRGKGMDPDKILAALQVGKTYHMKLADSREVLMKVKSIDKDEIRGDMAVSLYSGDSFKNEAMQPDAVILTRNVSEIQTKKFSYPKTFLLLGIGIVVFVVSEEAYQVRYK